jgi:integrase
MITLRGKVSAMYIMLKGLFHTKKRLADGQHRTYWYAWRGGPRLDGDPGSPEFIASFNSAIATHQKASIGILNSILDDYQDSEAFRRLGVKTKRDYKRHLVMISETFGDCPVKVLNDRRFRGDVLKWRDGVARKSPRQADYIITVFARALSWAENRGLISENVLKRPERIWKGTRAEKTWSDEDEARFLELASPRMALALMLALWTGQRQGDLLRLPWSAYDGHVIKLRQSKTGVRVTVPVGEPLKAILDATPRVSTIIISNEDKRPFTSDGFRASWRKTCARAGITGLTFHDLRGTAVTRLALAGCTEIQIATFTGHAVSSVKSIMDKFYLSRDPSMAVDAVKKLEKRTKSANRPANQPIPVFADDS